jgi:hypothetical protein
MGKIRIDHYHVGIGHQRFANDHIMQESFENLKSLDELLGLEVSGVCQSNGAKGLSVFTAAGREGRVPSGPS